MTTESMTGSSAPTFSFTVSDEYRPFDFIRAMVGSHLDLLVNDVISLRMNALLHEKGITLNDEERAIIVDKMIVPFQVAPEPAAT